MINKKFFQIIARCALFIAIGAASADAHKIKAVATMSIIGDVLKNVAGNAVDLVVLVGANGDVHEYEPVPADSVHLAQASIIFENGLQLERWLDKLYAASGSKAKRVVVSDGLMPRRQFEGHAQSLDPHAWQDVANVILYTKNIRDALIGMDPSHKGFYEVNARNYIQKLQTLDAWINWQVASIPVDKRTLVTNHDALGYFANRYGFQIIGAVIPSATTEAADPSAKQIADLIHIIKFNGVGVIFSENIANAKLAKTLSKEANTAVAPGLYTDALGPVGSEGETYIKMMKYNVGVLRKYLTKL